MFEHLVQLLVNGLRVAHGRWAGVSMLMVEQKARQCLAMSDHGYVLDMGQNRMHGSGEQLLNDREVIDLYLGSRGRLGVAALRLRQQIQTEV